MQSAARPHVLLLTDSLKLGGAERIVVELARGLDPERFRRTVCVTRPARLADPEDRYLTRRHYAEIREAGAELLELQRSSGSDLAAWRPLLRFLRRDPVDVLHAHKFTSNAWGAVLGRLSRVPVVLAHEHTWSFEGQTLHRVVDREVTGRLADRFITVSEADREKVVSVVGVPRERVLVVPTGIPALRPGDGAAVRRELGLPEGAPVVVAVSLLRAQKALDVLVRAMAVAVRTVPDAHLLIAGGGGLAGSLRELAGELGIGESVHLLGVRGDVPDLLACADLAALSSDYEGMPLAVLEYMAAGLPVVGTDVGGVPELIRDGQEGLIVPRRDPAALGAGIAALLGDPERRRAMGEAARKRQQEQFSVTALVRRMEGIYSERLASASRVKGLG